jgi:hypothetical protein
VELRKKRGFGDESGEPDPAEEMLEWAKDRIATVSESVPGRMGPRGATESKPEPDLATPDDMPHEAEPPKGTGPKPEPKLLVLALHEGTSEWAQAHMLRDGQDGSRFIEALIDNGLDPGRITVFWGTPMNVNVTYRAVVDIDHPEQGPP